MPPKFCITDATIVNEGIIRKGCVLVDNGLIQNITEKEISQKFIRENGYTHIDAQGLYLIPGIIDSHVHLREPGLTHKEDIRSGSRAAIAGGITSFMEMPNTVPQTITNALLNEKHEMASRESMANYSFYLGATNTNLDELKKADLSKVCGIKVFMGASTGNMLVDNETVLQKIFQLPVLIAAHCEDETIITKNLKVFKERFGEHIPFNAHPLIRSREACIQSTKKAISLARKHNSRLHVLHLSTAEEAALFATGSTSSKNITSEACLHHLWFNDEDYEKLGAKIKVNPAIKSACDREALLRAISDGCIDVISTDHAPHTSDEKSRNYTECPSGGPMMQHALPLMLELVRKNKLIIETMVQRMCHTPADCFRIEKRGYIRKGYHADLVLFDPDLPWQAGKTNILYKCGWSALEGQIFHDFITHTFVNGRLAYSDGRFDESVKGMPLVFE